jgi:flagellar biosynthesis anti-sigma factor FlgM
MNIDRTTSQRASEAYADNSIRQPTTTSGANATQGPQNVGDSGSAQTNAVSAGATIKLSPQAQLFAQALAAAQATPDVRADRVAAARARLANGDGEGDVTALAGKLLGKVDH